MDKPKDKVVTKESVKRTWNEYVDIFRNEGVNALMNLNREMKETLNEETGIRYNKLVFRQYLLSIFLKDHQIFGKEAVDGIDKGSIQNDIPKPHKDIIYQVYGNLKGEKGVKSAFYDLCDWIEELGYEVSEYTKTDTPENFDKSYRKWLKRK